MRIICRVEDIDCKESEKMKTKKEQGFYERFSWGRSQAHIPALFFLLEIYELWQTTGCELRRNSAEGGWKKNALMNCFGERRADRVLLFARCERITTVNNATVSLRYLFLMMANIPDTNRSPSVISSRLFLLAEDQLTHG